MTEGRPKIPKEVARALFVQAGHRCACCGTAFPLERAHIVPWRHSRDHSTANLICLCANCHEMADRDWDHATFLEYKSRPWVDRQGRPTENGVMQQELSATGTRSLLSPLSLRVLYFQSRPRSAGLDCLNSKKLVEELRQRGHEVRLCWVVHPPIPSEKDHAGVGGDILDPDTVRNWGPHALIFEDGLFRGVPRIPLGLLDDLESGGSVAVIELAASKIWSAYSNAGNLEFRTSLEGFLSSRGLELVVADSKHAHEHPVCKASSGKDIVIDVAELRSRSCVPDAKLFSGIRRIGVAFAVPLRWHTGSLLSGGNAVYVKAYNSSCHRDIDPPFGFLYDRRGCTEAIFTGDIIWDGADGDGAFDNHIYIANLVEVLYANRSFANQTGWSGPKDSGVR